MALVAVGEGGVVVVREREVRAWLVMSSGDMVGRFWVCVYVCMCDGVWSVAGMFGLDAVVWVGGVCCVDCTYVYCTWGDFKEGIVYIRKRVRLEIDLKSYDGRMMGLMCG